MIRFYRHNEIDQMKWDEALASSPYRMPYACSWYLNLVAPQWCALIEDDYINFMPIPVKTRLGITYVPHPPYTQQLGVFGKDAADADCIHRFVKILPSHFRLADISLNAANPVVRIDSPIAERMNLELNLHSSVEMLTDKYPENTRRNISRSCKSGIRIASTSDPAFLLDTKWKYRPIALKCKQWQLSGKIIQEALRRNLGEIWEATTVDGEKIAAVFFLNNDIRKIYLISASTERGKEYGAMFLIVDEFIRMNAGKPIVLDFEGSAIPGIARFFRGFGAQERPYHIIRINNLPRILQLFLSHI